MCRYNRHIDDYMDMWDEPEECPYIREERENLYDYYIDRYDDDYVGSDDNDW